MVDGATPPAVTSTLCACTLLNLVQNIFSAPARRMLRPAVATSRYAIRTHHSPGPVRLASSLPPCTGLGCCVPQNFGEDRSLPVTGRTIPVPCWVGQFQVGYSDLATFWVWACVCAARGYATRHVHFVAYAPGLLSDGGAGNRLVVFFIDHSCPIRLVIMIQPSLNSKVAIPVTRSNHHIHLGV